MKLIKFNLGQKTLIRLVFKNNISTNFFNIKRLDTWEVNHFITSRNYYDYKTNKISILSKHLIDNIRVSRVVAIFRKGGYLNGKWWAWKMFC